MTQHDNKSNVAVIKKRLMATKAKELSDRAAFVLLFDTLYNELDTQANGGSETVLVVDTLTIWLVRACQYASAFDTKFTDDECLPAKIAHILLFICDCLDLRTGPLSNAMTSLLARLCQFLGCLENVDPRQIYTPLLQRVLRLPMTLKSFYVILDTLCKESETVPLQLLEMLPSFPKQCIAMLEYGALANVASKLFASVMLRAYGPGTTSFDKYLQVVIDGLLNEKTRSSTASSLLPILFRGAPELYKQLLREITNGNYDDGVFLAAAKIGHSIVPNFEEFDDFDKILLTLASSDPIKRLDALEVIVGCVKSTKASRTDVLTKILSSDILEIFFRESQTPQLRNRFITSLRKIVLALRDYVAKCEKQLAANLDFAETRDSMNSTRDSLIKIYDFAFSNMHPCSSYGQLVVATDVLQIFIDHEFDGVPRGKKKGHLNKTKIFDIFSNEFIQVMLRTTANNYEDIRQSASVMLISCPYELFESSIPKNSQVYFENTMSMLASLKGRQSDSAAQVFLTLANIYQIHNLDKFKFVLNSLHSGLQKAISDSKSAHGYFTTFAYILSATSSKVFRSYPEYFRELVCLLLAHIRSIWEDLKTQKSASDHSDNQGENWRVVRESSGLLDVLMRVNFQNDKAFFGQDEFLSICNLLMDQLVNVSHRGAFSAIHPTFVAACKICLENGLKMNLFEWLKENLSIIKTHHQLISRRSGGMPSLITAIINGMISDPEALQEALLATFSELLEIASQEYKFDGSETMDIPQVHAFNCMKHLIGEVVSSASLDQFINAALEISLQNLDHDSWSLKNAAVMLFTAVQIKIFGSNLMGDEIVKMNAPLFFLKYPGVSQILIDKLEKSLENVDVVIPVLSILSRLASHKPDDERVQAFLDVLESQYLGHKVWKVREMTAAIIASFTHMSVLCAKSELLAQSLMTLHSNNQIHGTLLCITNMAGLILSRDPNSKSLTVINGKTKEYFEHLSAQPRLNWPLLFGSTKVFRSETIDIQTYQLLADFLSQQLESPTELPNSIRRLCLTSVADLIIQADLKSGDVSSIVEKTKQALKHKDEYEVISSYLHFWKKSSISPTKALLFDVSQTLEAALTLARELVSEEKWPYLTTKVLDYLAHFDSSVSFQMSEISSFAAVSIFCLSLNQNSHNVTLGDVDLLKKFSGDDQEEKDRLASVRAASVIVLKANETSIQSMGMIVLFQKLFDSSSEVRQFAASTLAGHLELPTNEVITLSHQALPLLRHKYPERFSKLLLEESHTISRNIEDATEDIASTQFEVECNNLYIDEVAYHKLLVSEIAQIGERDDFIEDATKQVRFVSGQISQNFTLVVSTWNYNIHLAAAISKAFNYGLLPDSKRKISDALKELAQKLGSLGYPVDFS